ncbi:MAG: SHOCT domain-containing protein [Phormidesmis sp.]
MERKMGEGQMGEGRAGERKMERKVAIALAFAGALPTPLPLSWLHKFYLGQYLWGIVYLVLAPTLLPQVACCLEGVWYLSQSDERFLESFPKAGALISANAKASKPGHTQAQAAQQMAIALRELEQLRQEGLMTEYEFEQKRRKLLVDID